jgi:hypothetical protein
MSQSRTTSDSGTPGVQGSAPDTELRLLREDARSLINRNPHYPATYLVLGDTNTALYEIKLQRKDECTRKIVY